MSNNADITVKVLEFTEYPGPRNKKQGNDSGEDFYHAKLNSAFCQAYKNNVKLVLDLDNTGGYLPSFLDEAIGNLVYDFSLDEVKKRLVVVSVIEPDWKEMIEEEVYPAWEERRLKQIKPLITGEYDNWYKLVDGEIKLGDWR